MDLQIIGIIVSLAVGLPPTYFAIHKGKHRRIKNKIVGVLYRCLLEGNVITKGVVSLLYKAEFAEINKPHYSKYQVMLSLHSRVLESGDFLDNKEEVLRTIDKIAKMFDE